MSATPILDRMAAALADLAERWNGKRRPKAFYLGPDDWADFIATRPPTISTIRNREPAVEPGFENVPVRASKNVPPRQSRIYDHSGAGRPIPVDPSVTPAPRRPALVSSDVSADEVFAALDAISRTRALTESESEALEAAMHGRITLTTRDAARLGIKRMGLSAVRDRC